MFYAGELGFTGLVVSDYDGIQRLVTAAERRRRRAAAGRIALEAGYKWIARSIRLSKT